MAPISGPDHNHLTIGKADVSLRTFLALLLTGILLSIVGAFVEGLPWLTAVGMLTFFSAAVYAVLSSRSQERRDAELQPMAGEDEVDGLRHSMTMLISRTLSSDTATRTGSRHHAIGGAHDDERQGAGRTPAGRRLAVLGADRPRKA